MQGRVLAEAFEGSAAIGRIPSWESVPGEAGMHPPDLRQEFQDSTLVMKQLAALGYIEAPAPEAAARLRQVRAHRAFSLARVYLIQRRAADALP